MRAHQPRLAPLFLLVLATAAASMTLPAARAQVRDEGDFFTPDAERQANFDIRDVQQRFGVDLLVDTFPGIPSEMRPQYEQLGKEKFFEQWADQRARDAKINGAIILVSKDPSYLRVSVGRQTRQKAFTTGDADELRTVMTTAFRARQYDQGMLQGVAAFRKTLQRNLGDGAVAQAQPGAERSSRDPVAGRNDQSRAAPAPPAPEPRVDDGRRSGPSVSSLLIWAVLIFGGIWLIRRLIAGRRAPTGPGGYGQPARGYPGQPQPGYDPRYGDPNAGPAGYGRAGGGFGTGLGGGLLGGLLGGWLGGQVFGRGGQAHGSDNANAAGTTDAGAGHLPQQDPGTFDEDAGPEFAGSGGDFGGDSGGGDSGSGGDF